MATSSRVAEATAAVNKRRGSMGALPKLEPPPTIRAEAARTSQSKTPASKG